MESTKYRHKPLVVDAEQWTGQVSVTLGQGENERSTVIKCYSVANGMGLLWKQNDCEIIHSGDYIVLDADGRFSRVDRAAFEALYEACPEANAACVEYEKADVIGYWQQKLRDGDDNCASHLIGFW